MNIGLLVDMVGRSNVSGEVIVIADRGYESYNVLAHIAQKGWNYVIRAKDITSNGIVSALPLPDSDEFDIKVALNFDEKTEKGIQRTSGNLQVFTQGSPI